MFPRGIGVDLTRISRVGRLYARYRSRFAQKFLHADELADFKKLSRYSSSTLEVNRFLATRWAAKEAVFKAISSAQEQASIGENTLPRLDFRDILLSKRKVSGVPNVKLCKAAQRIAVNADISKTMISISHEEEYVIAFVNVY